MRFDALFHICVFGALLSVSDVVTANTVVCTFPFEALQSLLFYNMKWGQNNKKAYEVKIRNPTRLWKNSIYIIIKTFYSKLKILLRLVFLAKALCLVYKVCK